MTFALSAFLFFLLNFICSVADVPFVISPSQSNPVVAVGGSEAGKASASKLSAALAELSSGDDTQQFEPVIDEPKDDEDEKEARNHLLHGAKLFNAASSHNTEEQQAAEDALAVAMQSPSHIGKPDRTMPRQAARACLPDFFQCPKHWTKKGVLCSAPSNYSGKCSTSIDLSEMNAEQKQAAARTCKFEFECQEDCMQDFRQPCPSLWSEIGAGICSAPPNYDGPCSHRLSTKAMSEKDKYVFSVRCGARWQCAPPIPHQYEDICPSGWELQFGQVCAAPKTYSGPCEPLAQMSGMSVDDKKKFEATCDVSWPEGSIDCVHDYSAKCPFGWFQGSDCLAPVTYSTCGKAKQFDMQTPSEKADWAAMCKVKFPCKDRDVCEKEWAAPCPADWYAVNGGASCVSPSSYLGNCSSVLHGLMDLSPQEKEAVASKCAVAWPCKSEVYEPIVTGSYHPSPRGSNDPAQYLSDIYRLIADQKKL